jgi:restriction endonuclease Mrr
MVDKRFVDEVDILADLDHRPNLLKLTPTEFESLIQNLFAKMGLDKTAFEFANGKPLELIDGANLLYLLAEHADLKARIDASELDI